MTYKGGDFMFREISLITLTFFQAKDFVLHISRKKSKEAANSRMQENGKDNSELLLSENYH